MRKTIALLALCLFTLNVALASSQGAQDAKKPNTFAELARFLRDTSKNDASEEDLEKLVELSDTLMAEDPFAKRQFELIGRVTLYLYEQGEYEHAEHLCTELIDAAGKIKGRSGEALVDRAKDSLKLVRDKMGTSSSGGSSMIGKPMPLSGKTVAGDDFDSSEYEGKYVLVDFWATWCGPCIAELPNVKANYEKYHNKGLEIVGISLDKAGNAEGVAKFTTQKGITWVNLFSDDPKATGWKHPLATEYGINAIPATFLLDKEGNVIAQNLRGEALGKKLEELFSAEGAR